MIRTLRPALQLSVFLLVALLIPVLPAAAQGTKGVFPDPLDWRSFRSAVEPLGLAEDQMIALEAVHGRYLDEFMIVRDGPVTEFMAGEDRWFKAGNHNAQETKDRVTSYRKISRRIDSIESNLFDAIGTILGPNQAERLQIVRDLRERQRKLSAPWPWEGFSPHSGITQLELRTVIDWNALSQQEQQVVEGVLAGHEAERTRLVRQLHEQRFKGRIREVEIEDERGPITFDKEADKIEGWRLWQQLMLERHQEAYGDAIKTDAKLRDSLHRGLAQLRSVLSNRAARDLWWTANRRAYPVGNMGIEVRPMVVDAINRQSDDEDIVSALEELLSSHDARTRPHYEEAIREYDQQAQEAAGSFMFMAKVDEEDGESPAYLDNIKGEQIETARSLQAILDGDSPEMLNRMLTTLDGEDVASSETIDRYGTTRSMAVKSTVVVGSESDEADGAVMIGGSSTSGAAELFGSIPQPMTVNDMEVLSGDLGIDGETWEIVETLHESYTSDAAVIHAEFRRKQQSGMMKMAASSALGKSKDDFDVFLDFNATITRLQQESTDGMESLDNQLFDDLILAVENAEDQRLLHWHRLARRRLYDTVNVDPFGDMMMDAGQGGSAIGNVDLMEQLSEVDLSPESRAIALAASQDWHEPATAATAALAQLSRDHSSMMGQLFNAKSGENNDPQQAMKVWELAKENTARRNVVLDECAARNTKTTEAILAALPPLDAAAFSIAMRKASFPMVYRDPAHMEMKLLAAMELDDLDDNTRAELLMVYEDYSRRYEHYCDALVELAEDMPPPMALGKAGTEGQSAEHLWSEMERVRFERNDLSAKTRDRLRNLLTEQQIQAIGGLNTFDPSPSDRYKF
ncbi:MAG: hypothetical protein P8L37_06210 [Phycisphaerales bacterium]|nr:hypothetical protein [Phycisphaerales bacterium]